MFHFSLQTLQYSEQIESTGLTQTFPHENSRNLAGRPYELNLLFISDETEENFHYCWITKFEKQVSSQITHSHGRILYTQNMFHA